MDEGENLCGTNLKEVNEVNRKEEPEEKPTQKICRKTYPKQMSKICDI